MTIYPRKGRVKGVPKAYASKKRTQPRKLDDLYFPVTESGCWIWAGQVTTKGYGVFKGAPAHRVFYQLHHGRLPVGLHVCHKCDTPMCVNPQHLFAGTHGDNMSDMSKKDRVQHGDKHHNAKLTSLKVMEMRAMFEDGLGNKEIAEAFGVCEASVWNVRNGKTWVRA